MPISQWGMVRDDGSPIPLNSHTPWLNSYDIRNLATGYYVGYVQTTNKNSNYGIARNLPSGVDGYVVLIEIIDYGYENRRQAIVTRNSDGDSWTTSISTNNVVQDWRFNMRTSDDYPMQQYRLTFADGTIPHWRWGTSNSAQQGNDNLIVPITSLNSGWYAGSIDAISPDNRQLPMGVPVGQLFTAMINRTATNRKTILLMAQYTASAWIGTTGVNSELVTWKRIDKEEDYIGRDKAMFSIAMNKMTSNNFKLLAITDTHWQELTEPTQIAYVNPLHFNNIEDLDRQIKTNDITVHLGDWIDGNYTKKEASYSLAHLGSKFFEKPNRYGVIGNHDYNGQWDGNAGNHANRHGLMSYMFNTDEVKHFLTPNSQPYYFVDHSDKKIRAIYLHSFDFPFWTNPQTGKTYVDTLNQRAFGAKQIEWMIRTLNSVPIGYNVVIFTHETMNQVYENYTYYNGDMMRTILEAYQRKGTANKMTTDIGQSNPLYDYYALDVCMDGCIDFTMSKGQILGVISGHRHEDNTAFKNGVRYITLLCSRPNGDGSQNKPSRNYYDATSEAITFLEFDVSQKAILSYRFGAGEYYRKYNMFTH